MAIRKCDKCNSIMIRKVIKAVDSHNNLIEYCCEKCGFKSTPQIEPIDDE